MNSIKSLIYVNSKNHTLNVLQDETTYEAPSSSSSNLYFLSPSIEKMQRAPRGKSIFKDNLSSKDSKLPISLPGLKRISIPGKKGSPFLQKITRLARQYERLLYLKQKSKSRESTKTEHNMFYIIREVYFTYEFNIQKTNNF